jgi:hypothetical protein
LWVLEGKREGGGTRHKGLEPSDGLTVEVYLDFECSLETTSKESTKWTNYRTED